jgi:hypothetical protein
MIGVSAGVVVGDRGFIQKNLSLLVFALTFSGKWLETLSSLQFLSPEVLLMAMYIIPWLK